MKPTSSHAAFEADFKAFLDGELPFWRRAQVRRHLQTCPPCREELRIMQLIETELKEETSPLRDDLRAKILDSAPVEAPKVAPVAAKDRFRKPLEVVFYLVPVCLVVVFALSLMGNRVQNTFNSAASSMDVIDAAADSAAKMQAPSVAPDTASRLTLGRSSVGASSAAEPTFARRQQSGPRWNPDIPSSDLRGIGNKIYLDDVVPAERQVHKQGSLAVTVDDAEAKGSATEILVKNVGGFVAQNALSTGEGGRKTATLDVRVPVEQFETVVGKIGKLGSVTQKSVNGEDITQRVTQAGAQKQGLARELSIREAQLRALSPKKAAERQVIVADVRQLRMQASQARAQLQYLQKYASLATLFVTLQDKAKPVPVASSTTELKGTARAAWSSFLATAQLPIQLLIWIAAYAPLWIPALLLWRKFGRKVLNAG